MAVGSGGLARSLGIHEATHLLAHEGDHKLAKRRIHLCSKYNTICMRRKRPLVETGLRFAP